MRLYGALDRDTQRTSSESKLNGNFFFRKFIRRKEGVVPPLVGN